MLWGCSGSQGPRPARPDDGASLPVLIARADSTAALGKAAEARDGYTRAAAAAKRTGVRDLEARAELGAALQSLELSEPAAAQRSLARALELEPRSAKAHDAMGRLHVATRRYLDAKNEFDRAAALDTLSAEPLYHLGQAYAQSGDPKRAADAFTRALARDPTHAPSLQALGSVSDSRYTAAGLPEGYGALRTHPSISRGELAVMLAGELGADPRRPSWGAKDRPSDTQEARGAWGEPWVRVSMAKGWIGPFPDGSYHLGDPVTRGTLALLITEIGGTQLIARPGGAPAATDRFPDLEARHYLARAAQRATETGLPIRPEGRFEAAASATGLEALTALRGLAKRLGVQPVVTEEPGQGDMVK
jgi:tetratricopeptide (TPR) repeat protein